MKLVAAAVADEIPDIAKILTNDEELRSPVAEPLLPMADHIGVEIEFGTAPNFSRMSLDANPASLTRSNECLKILHGFPARRLTPRFVEPGGGATDPRNPAVRDGEMCSRNSRDMYRAVRQHRELCAPFRRAAGGRHNLRSCAAQ